MWRPAMSRIAEPGSETVLKECGARALKLNREACERELGPKLDFAN
jgi:hypothetical protein